MGCLNDQLQPRLDRFLVSKNWECYFNGAVQCLLPRPISDHCPILLDDRGVRKGLSPFKFENMWLKEDHFKDLLKSWWMGFQFKGPINFTLSKKLKALKANLKTWNKEVFENISTRKESTLKQIVF